MFHPDLLEKYNGSTNPEKILQTYTTTIKVGGGGEKVMANYFHVALKVSLI